MKKCNLKKKVFFVTEALPYNNHGGANLTSLNISKILKKMFNVYLILLNNDCKKKITKIDKKLFKKIILLKHRKKYHHPYSVDNYLFGRKFQKKIFDLQLNFKPSLIFSYGFNALEAVSKINNILKIGSVGDPIYLPLKYRKNEVIKNINPSNFFKSLKFLLKYLIIDLIVLHKIKNRIKKLKKNFKYLGCFSFHHAKYDLNCEYFRTPLEQSKIFKKVKINKKKLILAHVGHFKGTVTKNSFQNLINFIVPKLIEKFGKDDLEILVYGKFYDSLPVNLKMKINSFGVFKFLGHIDKKFNNELNKVDALIVCNDIDLGSRIRILTAIFNKTLVITHQANLSGSPELKKNYNCLVGKNFDELIKHCILLKKNNKKNIEIKNRGYQTAKTYFSLLQFQNMIEKKYKIQENLDIKHKII